MDKRSKLRTLCSSNKYVLVSFAASLLVSLVFAISYKVVPFGDITVLRMDMLHQYGPLYGELIDKILGGGSLQYSWASGGGGNFLGNFFNYLSSPLSFLVFLFGHKNVPVAIGFLIAFKAAFTSAFLTYYLKSSRQFRFHNPMTAGLGLCYAFSAWFVAYYWNVMWIDGMMLLPLLVLGLERIIDERKPWLYCIALAVLFVSSYYMAYMTAIFLVLYFLTYTLGHYEFLHPETEAKPGKNGEVSGIRQFAHSKFLHAFLRCMGFALLAAGLAAFALFPTFEALKICSATSGVFPSSYNSYFGFFDFFANHMDSLEPTIRSSGDVILPNVFCGIGTVLLVVLFFYLKTIKLREKVAYAVLLAVLYFSFNVNYLNYIWHGFHFPNDLPYRESFVYIFVLVILAAKTLKHFHEIRRQDLLTVGLLTAFFTVMVDKMGSQNVDSSSVMTTLIFTVMYVVIFSLINNKTFRYSSAAMLVFCAFFAEMAASDVNHFEIDQSYSANTGDYQYYRQAIDIIDEYDQDDDGFYRLEKVTPYRCMDPCWYGYNGINEFSSMAYEMASNLQYNLGQSSNYINSYMYDLQTPVYNATFALKYLIQNNENVPMSDDYFEQIGNVDNLNIYRNKYWLPLGFAADSSIDAWNYYSSSPFKAQEDLWNRASGVKGIFENIPVDNFTYNNMEPFAEAIDSGSYTFHRNDAEQDASFDAEFTVPEDRNVFVYVRSADLETLHFYSVDGSLDMEQRIIDNSEYVYALGKIKKGTKIVMNAKAENTNGSVEIYINGVNDDKFREAYNKLNSGAMDVTFKSDTHLEGTVTIGPNQMLFTSINYDPGWDICVDGAKVPSDKIVKLGGALIGIRMDEGQHTVSFRYHSPGLRTGLLISLASLLLVLFLTLALPRLRGKRGNKKPAAKNDEKRPA